MRSCRLCAATHNVEFKGCPARGMAFVLEAGDSPRTSDRPLSASWTSFTHASTIASDPTQAAAVAVPQQLLWQVGRHFRKALVIGVEAQMKQHVDNCAGATATVGVNANNCPFAGGSLSTSGSITSIQWTMTAYPQVTRVAASYPKATDQGPRRQSEPGRVRTLPGPVLRLLRRDPGGGRRPVLRLHRVSGCQRRPSPGHSALIRASKQKEKP